MSTAVTAEVLAENLAEVLEREEITPADLDRRAQLPEGRTDRILAADVGAYPCPRQWHRITGTLEVTARDLLAGL